jgi:hypothetical protein
MSDIIGTLGFIGWVMAAIGVVAVLVNHGMRKEQERDKSSGRDDDVT